MSAVKDFLLFLIVIVYLSGTDNTWSVSWRNLAQHVITDDEETGSTAPFALNMPLWVAWRTSNGRWLLVLERQRELEPRIIVESRWQEQLQAKHVIVNNGSHAAFSRFNGFIKFQCSFVSYAYIDFCGKPFAVHVTTPRNLQTQIQPNSLMNFLENSQWNVGWSYLV